MNSVHFIHKCVASVKTRTFVVFGPQYEGLRTDRPPLPLYLRYIHLKDQLINTNHPMYTLF